jgi:hypothetical protein
MKQIKDFERSEKINFLKQVVSGEIDGNKITPETWVLSDQSEAMLGVMFAASQEPGSEVSIVAVGDAKKTLTKFFNQLDEPQEQE